MKRRFLSKLGLSIFLLATGIMLGDCVTTSAAPLQNQSVTLDQPDGQTIECYASGDEFYNYLHDEYGRAIIKDEKTGYYVYGKYIKDKVIPSRERVTEEKLNVLNNINNDSRVNMTEVSEPLEEIEKERELLGANQATQSTKNIGRLNNIVVFIKFSDQNEITRGLSVYDKQFNSQNQASLANFYKEASYNKLDVNTTFYPKPQGDKVISYTDSHPRSYYANVPSNERGMREQTLLKNAIDSIKNQIPKDLNIDSDNDGKVDNVCFIIKGTTTGWSTLLWPHKWGMYYQHPEINGKKVDTYNFQLEDYMGSNGVGVLSHEMFHTLGARDLYHYNHDGKVAVGPWDLMEQHGSVPQSMGAYMKMYYGKWINNINEISKPGKYSIKSLSNNETDNSYIIKSPNSASEYFVVEYRKKQGLYESGLPGQGLLVYRINTAFKGRGNSSGNDEVYLYRPSGSLTSRGNLKAAALGSSKTSISSSELFLSNGRDSGISLNNISILGDNVNFNVVINGKSGETGVQNPYTGKKFNFTFKGYADKIFAELGLDLINGQAKFDIKGIKPHYYFNGSYASVLIKDTNGNIVYERDIIGDKVNEALAKNIAIKPGYYITIKHREPDTRLVIINTENKLELDKDKIITYKITDTGLVKVSDGEIKVLPLKSVVNFDDTKVISADCNISGECVSGKNITNIEMDIDGKKYKDAERSKLNDYQNKYVGYDLSKAAFKITLSSSSFNNGSYSYKIIATTEDGVKNTLKQGTLNVKKQTSGGGTEQTNQWKSGTSYKVGDIVNYNGINYKCLQAHRAITTWSPGIAMSLWSKVTQR